jgi:hypothetical protein
MGDKVNNFVNNSGDNIQKILDTLDKHISEYLSKRAEYITSIPEPLKPEILALPAITAKNLKTVGELIGAIFTIDGIDYKLFTDDVYTLSRKFYFKEASLPYSEQFDYLSARQYYTKEKKITERIKAKTLKSTLDTIMSLLYDFVKLSNKKYEDISSFTNDDVKNTTFNQNWYGFISDVFDFGRDVNDPTITSSTQLAHSYKKEDLEELELFVFGIRLSAKVAGTDKSMRFLGTDFKTMVSELYPMIMELDSDRKNSKEFPYGDNKDPKKDTGAIPELSL